MAISARIDELKKKFDENPRRYFASLANEYRKSGDLDQALFICQEYLPQQPGHMSGHIVYAQTLYEMGRYEDARAEFESALALDPENLIALRHLGDIARQGGDFRLARGWYQRVLEADPRNGEIADLLATIRTTPLSSPQVLPPSHPTPASTASFAPQAPAEMPTAAVDPAPSPAPEPVAEDDSADEDLLDFESLELPTTPLSSATIPSQAGTFASHDFDTGSDDAGGVIEEAESDGVFGAEAFEADVFAIEAQPTTPEIELATDVNLGLVAEDTQAAAPEDIGASPLIGLRSYEPGVVFDSRDHVAGAELETEPFYDVFGGDANVASSEPGASSGDEPSDLADTAAAMANVSDDRSADPGADGSSDFSDREATPSSPVDATTTPPRAATPASSGIFVTETMAELYLQQGHHDAALETYRKLLESRPNDELLAERVRSIEAQLSSHAATDEVPAATHDDVAATTTSTTSVGTGPTIREFLLGVVGGRDAAQLSRATENVESSVAVASDPNVPSGSIDALFPSVGTSDADAAAATALADAFSDTELASPSLDGLPSHKAEDELSLDQVFKAGSPRQTQSPSGGFSFDQFFAGEAKQQTPPSPSAGTGTPPVEGADDVAQFNAWLNGLKKT